MVIFTRNKISLFMFFAVAGFIFGSPAVDANEETSTAERLSTAEDKEVALSDMQPMVDNQFKSSISISHFVQSMLERSRKENDTVKILCLDDKLTQIHALLKGIENRMGALDAALSANDNSGARHQFVILQVSFNKLNGLRVQADACVGNNDIVAGASETEVSVNEDITLDDATTPGQEIFTPEPVVRPTVASGFR